MEFRYEPHPGYLRMVATGPYDIDLVRQAIGEAKRRADELGLDRVLVDARALPSSISITERFDIAAFLAARKSTLRISILVTQENHDLTKIFEHTAVNRGTALITTASEAEALAFLGIRKAE